MRTPLVGLLLLAAVPCPGQETAPPAAAQAFLHIAAAGPAAWRSTFLPTNLGSFLASQEGENLWRPWVSGLEEMLSGIAGKDDYQKARGRLLDYGGDITVQVWMEARAPGNDTPVAWRLEAAPDGRTDLGALAGELTRGLTRMLGQPGTRQAGDRELTAWAVPDGWVTTPQVIDGRLVVIMSNQDDAARGLAMASGSGVKVPARQGVLALHLDVAAVRRLTADDDEEENAMMRRLGFDSLGTLMLRLGAAGPRAQLELGLDFTDAPRGLFGALFPQRAGVPALRRLLPASIEQWKVGRFDAREVYLALEAVAAAFGNGDPAEVRKEIVAELGFDPVDDLLAHATDEVLVLGDMPLPRDRGDERGIDWGLVLRLRDGAAFAGNWRALLGKAGPTLQVQERYEHQGTAVQVMGGMFFPTFHTAVTDGLLCLTFGPEAGERMAALLDAERAGGDEPALPTLLREVAPHAPPGLNGQALLDLDTLIGRQTLTFLDLMERSVLGMGMREIDLDLDDVRDRIDALVPLLRQHQLDRVASMTGCADGCWRMRAFW